MNNATIAPAKFLVDPFELRKAGTVLLTAVALIEASHSARAGRPISLLFGQATLAPIVADLVNLAAACGHTASNYEACESALTPRFLKDFGLVEPKLIKAAAAVALELDSAVGGGETGVTVSQTRVSQSASVTSVSSLLTHLAKAGKSQEIIVSVTRTDSGRQYVLYLPGTQNWHLIPGNKAFDLTSDLAAMASPAKAAPERAAIQIMQHMGFGKEPGDSVLIAGYSEGGLIGANLIQSGSLSALGGVVGGLVAVGSPVSSAKLSPEIPVISLEHTNDLVPKVDLAEHAQTEKWLTQKLPASGILGHSLDSYQKSLGSLSSAKQAQINLRFAQMLQMPAASAQTTEVSFVVNRVGG